jgi:hypothetical protein
MREPRSLHAADARALVVPMNSGEALGGGVAIVGHERVPRSEKLSM